MNYIGIPIGRPPWHEADPFRKATGWYRFIHESINFYPCWAVAPAWKATFLVQKMGLTVMLKTNVLEMVIQSLQLTFYIICDSDDLFIPKMWTLSVCLICLVTLIKFIGWQCLLNRETDWLINPLKCFFGIKGYVALDRNQGLGYNTLLLRLIPRYLLSACPHRQFHSIRGLSDNLGCTDKYLP